MAKKIINTKAATLARIQRTESYAAKVQALFDQTVKDIIALSKTLPKTEDGVMFSFDDQGLKKQKEVEALLRRLQSAATLAIQRGVTLEWDEANKECDQIIKSAFGKEILSSPQFTAWTQRNKAARDAFLDRSDKGMKLSDRVWKNVKQLRDEMEVAITVSIGEGESASSMSRKVKQYLNDPDLMFRRFRYKIGEKEVVDPDTGEKTKVPVYGRKWKKRVRQPDGTFKFIDYDKEKYQDEWTGKGYYKSATKNAMRMTRTETNIAYRKSDHQRWSQMDFVLGIRIQVSHSHTEKMRDICDKLAGDYPKEFEFDGWHPQCFCYATPILIDEDEMAKVTEAFLKGETYTPRGKQIRELPENFKNWVTDHKDKILDARDRGKEPYFLRNNKAIVDNIIDPQPKELTTLEKAEKRHRDRTPEQIDAIKKAAAERQHKHTLIKKTANNIVKVGKDYGEVDLAKLNKYIKAGDLDKMSAETKIIAKQIAQYKHQEQSLSDLIPNAHELHQSYSMADLQEAYKELEGVLNKWLSKYSYSSIDSAPLDHLRNKLDFELTSPTITYSNKEIVNKAINEKISLINRKIEWNDLVSQVSSLKSFKTKSTIYQKFVDQAEEAIKNNDFEALRKSINDAEAQRQKLIDKQIKRGGDTKTALNKEYKGGAVGKDITSGFDVKKMKSEDPYGGTFTNNAARMQGFDAPAKLVSAAEFDILEKGCGDVFFRTVNPTKFKGKQMSSAEFAAQLYEADLLELNGPGGRVHGDGMYVATSAWDGRKWHSLTASRKREALDDSECYGRGNHTVSEMTWTRKPKLIKYDELYDMWSNLSRAEKAKYGGEMNTYGCALGYDAMLCGHVNYMVIWNRSIIAVKIRP